MAVDDRTRIGSGLLVMTGFGLGAAFGLLVRGGVQWGTVGEWVGGIGALVAAVVALQLGRSESVRIQGDRRARECLAANKIKLPLSSSLMWARSMLGKFPAGAPTAEQLTRLASTASAFASSAALEQLQGHSGQFVHLPNPLAVALETSMGMLEHLQQALGVVAAIEDTKELTGEQRIYLEQARFLSQLWLNDGGVLLAEVERLSRIDAR